MPVAYEDLLDFSESIPLSDEAGNDTLWATVCYDRWSMADIHQGLLGTYAFMRSDGDMSFTKHLIVDRVDLCLYGNTRPFRIRIANTLNENFEYFYIKQADANRIFGLELEHILSPNRIGFFSDLSTLVEEHIYGLPGDMFLERFVHNPDLSKVRLAKEFVKFNERCFLRLLGDMHSANFVIDITMDFEMNFYRIRAIDFDQQSHEPGMKVYSPRFFPENKPFVEMAIKNLPQETITQYQNEERTLILKRMQSSQFRFEALLKVMKEHHIAPYENVEKLAHELGEYYKDDAFATCRSMGDLVECSLNTLDEAARS